MHLCFVPLTEDKRLCVKEILGNKKKLTQWQDKYWEHMVKKYPDLERGESASETGRDHIPTRVFKQMTRLTKQKEKLDAMLSDVKFTNYKDRTAQVMDFLDKYIPDVAAMETLMKKYQKCFTTAESEKKALKKKNDDLTAALEKSQQQSTQKISMKVDTSAIEQEIANYEKQLRQSYSIKSRLIEEIDTLDPDDKHYIKRKADLDDRLYKMYDKIEDTESLLIEARAKKTAIEAEKLTADNIYKVLIYFDKLYAVMDEQERRQLMESLISEIHIFEERKPNGQWLKSIKFKLPIIEEDMEISLDNDTQVETVALLMLEK